MARYGFRELVIDSRTGLNPRTNFTLGEGNNYYITIKDIHDGRVVITDKTDRVNDEAIAIIKKRSRIKNGDILFTSIGRIGETAIVENKDDTWDVNESVFVFTLNRQIISPEYFCIMFQSDDVQDRLMRDSSGSTFKSIKMNQLEKMTFDVPDIRTQQKVSSSLQKVTHLISLRKQQIAKLDELVKARFVEMFETGQWSTVKASNFMSNMRNGVSPSNSGTISAKVLTLSAITQGTFDKDAWKDGIFDIEPSEDKRISSCDFYMCRGNGNKNLVGSGVYAHENYYDLVFPDTVIAAQIDTSQVMLPFLFHAWKRPSVRSQIEAGARTTNGTYKINQKVIASVEIVHPPLDLQHQFAVFVAQTDQQKLTIQHSLAQLELLKKALMQKYFG